MQFKKHSFSIPRMGGGKKKNTALYLQLRLLYTAETDCVLKIAAANMAVMLRI